MDEELGIFQVIFISEMKPAVEQWLQSRGAHLVDLGPVHIEGDDEDDPTVPLFGVGINDKYEVYSPGSGETLSS